MGISQYSTLVFDCDGVILDSNRIKTQAFFQAARLFGDKAASALVEYHKENGGVSRYKKFEYFLSQIVGVPINKPDLDLLLDSYAGELRKGLLSCQVSPALYALREATKQSRWLIVSGGDQCELRELMGERGLAPLFDGGIFGSPDDKHCILAREISNSNIGLPALFLGDSRYDYESATQSGCDFVFVSDWTEYGGWRELQKRQRFPSIANLCSLLG